MQVSVEKPSQGLEHTINVTFDAADFNAKVEKRLQEVKRTVKMNGFRPGKVPFAVVKKRYTGSVQNELLGEALHNAFFDAVEKENLKVAGYPEYKDVDLNETEIKFSAVFEIYPEISLPKFADLKVTKVSAEVADKDVEDMIEKLREQRFAWKVAGAAKKADKGNQVMIDFVGRVDGVEFDGGKAENVPLELGSGRMIPGFEDGIIGMKKGETKTIEVTFPEAYQVENLKGKTAEFDITVHSVQTKELPELDEDFIKSFGVEDGTIESLKKDIRDNMERELTRAVEAQNRKAAFEAVDNAVEVEIPQAMIKQESEAMLEQYLMRLEQQGLPRAQMSGMSADLFAEEAKKRVKMGLVVGEVISGNKLEATQADIDAYIEEQASSYEDPAEVKDWYKNNPESLREIRAILVETKVADLVFAAAKVTDEKKSFNDLVNQAA